MSEIIEISDEIRYIKATEDPLSADVIVISGRDYIWLFDVGNSEESLRGIREIVGRRVCEVSSGEIPTGQKKIAVVLSHFHPDHMGNIGKINFDRLYCGNNTAKYLKNYMEPEEYQEKLVVISEDLYVEDGGNVHIFPIPSGHAKGCVGLEIDGQFAFWGDASYPGYKKGVAHHNVSLIREQIRLLEGLSADYVGLSHRERLLIKKNVLVRSMKGIRE